MRLEITNKGDKKALTPKDLCIKIDGVEISPSLLSLELGLRQGAINEAWLRIQPDEIHVDADVFAHLQGVLNDQKA